MRLPNSRPGNSIKARPSREAVPRRLIVTAGVAAFAVCDWSLWVLLRDGPWGPPMRLVLGNELVSDAVERTMEAVLLWPQDASLVQLKADWQEQKVQVWGSDEQGAGITLIHSILLRANRDQLRPNLHQQPVPSLHVSWVPVVEIETGERELDPEVRPGLLSALYTLRSYVQREPEVILRYLADMDKMSIGVSPEEWWQQEGRKVTGGRETLQLNVIREPVSGDGMLTLAEAALLYRAFFPPDEPIDLSNLRRRFLATNRLLPGEEERPVRGREMDWRRVSRAYRYLAQEVEREG
ncbi:hypothetical protein [Ktedonobacter robiniae]|uniref:POTRA domain-containing protein n=1 Tax=Ktedonobacter robiniae TaxID=2778365 RepID=A0ABQ3URB3_9CHLR|nr:hypothetical protein [Ktedonobacter robiniae]GHO55245.1 hypothetical protein KSB_37200 [Ktedonobacter robiniae]